MLRLFTVISFFALIMLTLCDCSQKQEAKDLPYGIERITENLYYMSGGSGFGNIGILISEEGVLLIDSGDKNSATSLLTKLESLTWGTVTHIVNTHYHRDNTGGNKVFGGDITVICHENCKKSLSDDYSLQYETYTEKMELEFENQKILLLHPGNAHTAGDTVVIFQDLKVIHAGDLFFNGFSPFIDVENGADTQNWIEFIETLATKYPDFTVIPGHGDVTDMKEWLKFRDYLKYLREQIAAAIEQDKTMKQTVESIDLEQFSYIKDIGSGITKKDNIEQIYAEMKKRM